MKPHISATLAALLILLSACAGTPNAGLADRSPMSQASPCQQTKNMKFTKGGEGFEDPGQPFGCCPLAFLAGPTHRPVIGRSR